MRFFTEPPLLPNNDILNGETQIASIKTLDVATLSSKNYNVNVSANTPPVNSLFFQGVRYFTHPFPGRRHQGGLIVRFIKTEKLMRENPKIPDLNQIFQEYRFSRA